VTYRDELGQAHARIARLEQELREERAKRMTPPPTDERAVRWGWRFIVGFVLLGMATPVLVFLLRDRAGANDDPPVPVVAVDTVVGNEKRYVGTKIRVQGEYVRGSASLRNEPTCDMRFALERNGLRMPVRYTKCTPPEGFRDVGGLMIVVQGALGEDGVFVAGDMLVRMPDHPMPSMP